MSNVETDFLVANAAVSPPDRRNYDSVDQITSTDRSASRNTRKFPQYVAAIAATLSAFSAGITLGWTSPIVTEIEAGKYHNITVTDDQMGWIGSLPTLGAALTCIPTGFVCDWLGRKTTLLLIFIPFAIGWPLLIFAKTLAMLYFGRFITGMAVGASCIAAPLYVSEIAQKEIRGTLGSYFQLMVTVGVLYAYAMGAALSPTHYTIVCASIPLVFLIVFAAQPESPLYYIKKGKYQKAEVALKRLRSPDISEEFNEIEATVKNTQGNIGLLNTLRRKACQKAIVISLSLMFFQQFSGINVIIFYTTAIFKDSNVTIDPKIATIIVGTAQVIATFISSLVVDKLGRKVLLICSAFLMSLSMFTLGTYFSLKAHGTDAPNLIPIISLVVFIIVFSLGFGPIPWLISAEIFTPEIKSLASSVAGAFNWFLAFFITKYYVQVEKVVGEDNTFFFFGTVLFFATPFVWLFVPETKGKSLIEIQELLQ